MENNIYQYLETLIKKNENKLCISIIKFLIKNDNTLKELILLESRINYFEEKRKEKLITEEVYLVEINNINYALLTLLSDNKKELLDNASESALNKIKSKVTFYRKERSLTFIIVGPLIPIPSSNYNRDPISIYLDGKEIEKIYGGETKEINIFPGPHDFLLKFEYSQLHSRSMMSYTEKSEAKERIVGNYAINEKYSYSVKVTTFLNGRDLLVEKIH